MAVSNGIMVTLIEWFFSVWVFFLEHSRITGQRRKGGHPLHRHLGISRVFTAEILPLHTARSRTRTENPYLPSTNHYPLSYSPLCVWDLFILFFIINIFISLLLSYICFCKDKILLMDSKKSMLWGSYIIWLVMLACEIFLVTLE